MCKPSLQCVQQQTEGSSGQGSGGDYDCPTGQSVPSTCPLPPGWDETWQSPQTPPETKERKRERRITADYSGVRLFHGKGCNRHYHEPNADGEKSPKAKNDMK